MISLQNAINNLKSKGAEFTNAYSALVNLPNAKRYPNLYDKQQTLIKEGNAIKATISNLTKTIDTVAKTASNILGNAPEENLGVAPVLLSVPVILAGIAAISYFVKSVTELITDYNTKEKALQIYNATLKTTNSTNEAVNAANDFMKASSREGVLSQLQKVLPLVIGAGIIFYMIKKRG